MQETVNITKKNNDPQSQVNNFLKKIEAMEDELKFLRIENEKLKHGYFILQGVFPII